MVKRVLDNRAATVASREIGGTTAKGADGQPAKLSDDVPSEGDSAAAHLLLLVGYS